MYAGDPNAAAHSLEAATSAIPIFEAAGDRAGLARAWRLLFFVHGTLGRYDEAAAAAEHVVEHAKAAGDSRMAARGAQAYASAVVSGSLPISKLIEPCEQLMVDTAGDRKSQAVVAGALAQLYAMQGDFAKGREFSEQQRQMLAELGPSVTAWSTSLERARVELLAGDLEAAERELRADDAALAALDERYFRSTIVAMLAGVLASRGMTEEAKQAVDIARDLADEDDVASQVLWRTAHARLLADTGEPDAAIESAEGAVQIATEGDDIELLGDAKAALGDVFWIAGHPESAEPPLREALALYGRKEDVASASRVRLRLEVLLSGADPTAVG
jgi:tetratricopeptide (TPR) repeat protein